MELQAEPDDPVDSIGLRCQKVLTKAKPALELPGESLMKYGARNRIEGVVKRIKKGGVMAQVDLDVPDASTMSSVLTIDSLKDLGIKKGDRVRIVVKAIHVLLVRD